MLYLVLHPDNRLLLLSAVEDRPDADMKRLTVGALRSRRFDGDDLGTAVVVKVALFHC